jgi:hypothetical protein
MSRYSLVLAAGFLAAAPAFAASWADSLFDELKKDFGSVPHGQTQTHSFRVKNNTKGNVQISNIRVSCGCVSATALNGFLRPGEETTIQARMDTSRFYGSRSVTVFVQFSAPAFEEVRLWLSANSRNDFIVSPDNLAVGQVKRGAGASSSVTVTFYGNRAAQITKVRAESNYIQPKVTELRRLDHEVAYTLSAKVRPDTPVGKWYTDLWLETNVAGLAHLRVPLTVEIESPLTVNPPQVAAGAVKAGTESEQRVIVRGVEPFKILSVKGADDVISVRHGDEAREVHIITVKVKPAREGKLERTLKVVTDLKADNEIDLKVEAQGAP